MKIGTIIILAVAVIGVRPDVTIPALTNFTSNTDGPVFAGALFPFLFVTIACGALSGFHVMMSSGTTPHLIKKESQTRMIGYERYQCWLLGKFFLCTKASGFG